MPTPIKNIQGVRIQGDLNVTSVTGSFSGSLTGPASYVEYSNVGNKPSLISSSAQIGTEISGAFTSTSASLALDVTSLDGRLDTLEGKNLFSGSSQLNNSTLSGMSITGSFTGSFNGDGSALTGIVSASYALTASYAENGGGGGFNIIQISLISQLFS